MRYNPDKHSIKGPIAWMAGHSVAANLLMLIFLVGGAIQISQVKKEVFPDFDLDRVNITVPYPGASPEEVERGVILAIEEAVQGLEGVDVVLPQLLLPVMRRNTWVPPRSWSSTKVHRGMAGRYHQVGEQRTTSS